MRNHSGGTRIAKAEAPVRGARLATDPIFAEDGSQPLRKDVWLSNWIRVGQTLNMPPQIIEGKLRVLGALLVDPAKRESRVIGGGGYTS